MNRPGWWGVGVICALLLAQAAAQQNSKSVAEASPKQTQAHPDGDTGVVSDSGGEEPDEPVSQAASAGKKRPGVEDAWKVIEAEAKNSKPQLRIDALSAIGTLGGFARAEEIAKDASKDGERDVRLAAVVAMGTMKDRKLIPALRSALDDKAPEVSYAAAIALWKLHDRSGEPILYGVLAGERKAAPGFIGAEMHEANKDLHSPSALALIGAEQGAYALMGPFGIGLDAAKMMMMKGSSANSARVLTANLLADDPTVTTRRQFLDALHDKNYFVRSASARALGNFRGTDVSDALLETFADKKPSVRLMAAASYMRVSRRPGKSSAPAQRR